jgi:hypothetical protein
MVQKGLLNNPRTGNRMLIARNIKVMMMMTMMMMMMMMMMKKKKKMMMMMMINIET